MTSDESEWFLQEVVAPKKGAYPAGMSAEDSGGMGIELLWGERGVITAGWHDKEDPGSSLQFEVHGWFWYGHDLEIKHGL